MLRFLGDGAWTISQVFGIGFGGSSLAIQDIAYFCAYALLFAAMVHLVRITTHGIALVTALDAASIMLSAGVFVWFFILGPVAADAELTVTRAAAVALFQPVCDAALLFLCLVALSTDAKPKFAGILASALLSLLIADALYLSLRSSGPYEIGNWPDLFWSLGIVLIGISALHPATVKSSPEARIAPWRIFLFWFGPLSPSVHFSAVLAWGILRPPFPAYALAGVTAFLLYLTLRIALVSRLSRQLSHEREEAVRKLEQSRILYELHDSAKQGVHGVSMMIERALDANRRGEGSAGDLLRRALEAAREAEFRISKPYDEFQLDEEEYLGNSGAFIRQRLKKFEEYFSIKAHEDLSDSLCSLQPAELSTVNRVVTEAFWNVAKHSRARNVYLESRQVGSILIVRVRDDGCGFDPAVPPPGLGLKFMRRRAAEVGAKLDVISAPGRGTVVQVRINVKRRQPGNQTEPAPKSS